MAKWILKQPAYEIRFQYKTCRHFLLDVYAVPIWLNFNFLIFEFSDYDFKLYRKREIKVKKEYRDSRIKQAKEFILTKTQASKLNNQKWYELFDSLQDHRIQFKIKILVENKTLECDFIKELESTSILVDNSGNFIEFLEIDELIVNRSNQVEAILEGINLDYTIEGSVIKVKAYDY